MPIRVWIGIGIGELWLSHSQKDCDAIFIAQRNDDGNIERYIVNQLEDVKRRVELEGEKIRGQRFMGVSANGMYEPSWQRVETSDLDRFQNMLGKFDYVSKGPAITMTKDAIVAEFANHGVFASNRISFTLNR